jgi:dihydroorotase
MILKGGRIIDPASGTDTVLDILLKKGKDIKTGANLCPQFPDETVLDCRGLWILPGLVDIHTHLREPGYEYKETIAAGTRAAAAGGFTTIACMANTLPVNDTPAVTRYITEKAEKEGVVEVLPIGAATHGLRGERLSEIGLMKKAGIVALSDDGFSVRDAGMLRIVMEYARRFDLTLIEHCEDLSAAGSGAVHEGETATSMGLRGISSVSESVIVARDILMARWLGVSVHIAHISCRASVDLVRWGKEQGVSVTCEATPHHLALTIEDLCQSTYDTRFKVSPPLREEADRQALLSALKEGVIDCISTDHAPHDTQSKMVEFDDAANGISGLETAFPLALAAGREAGLTPLETIARVTIHPARVLNLNRGRLLNEGPPRLVVFNPDETWQVDPEAFFSKGKNTPFAGKSLRGRVKMTIFNGRKVFVDTDNPWGIDPVPERGVS